MERVFYDYVRQISPNLDFVEGEFIFYEGDICQAIYFTLQRCLRSFVIKNGKEHTLFFI